MKILFFLESLHSGGKERRAVELFHYLKQNTNYEIQIVLTQNEIHYQYLSSLEIPIIIIKRRLVEKDPFLFFRFYKVVKKFRPDIIHTWCTMTTLYAIPSAKIFNIQLINGQIANAVSNKYRSVFLNLIWKINRHLSSIVIANSYAGLKAYNVKPNIGVVIHNGIRLERFQELEEQSSVKKVFNINTPYTIIMVANFRMSKDYDLFFKVAKKVCNLRNDVTFVAVGEGETRQRFIEYIKREKLEKVLFTGRISNVEDLINACDIGLLFSNMQTGEGISNAIMEYMALSKPVIASKAGGTAELISDNLSGFLVDNSINDVSEKIMNLLDHSNLREEMGKEGRVIIENRFSVDEMGKQFIAQYIRCLNS